MWTYAKSWGRPRTFCGLHHIIYKRLRDLPNIWCSHVRSCTSTSRFVNETYATFLLFKYPVRSNGKKSPARQLGAECGLANIPKPYWSTQKCTTPITSCCNVVREKEGNFANNDVIVAKGVVQWVHDGVIVNTKTWKNVGKNSMIIKNEGVRASDNSGNACTVTTG